MTSPGTKTDNSNLRVKLHLRDHLLRKYHASGVFKVFDCCQGQGIVWKQLRERFPKSQYWGVNKKPKPGRLKIDSLRILQMKDWDFDVVDVDTYGSPWKHWAALIPNVRKPLTVFLTWGKFGGMTSMVKEEAAAMGLNFKQLRVPNAIGMKLSRYHALPYILGLAGRHGLKIVEVVEAHPQALNARYLGVRITPNIPPQK